MGWPSRERLEGERFIGNRGFTVGGTTPATRASQPRPHQMAEHGPNVGEHRPEMGEQVKSTPVSDVEALKRELWRFRIFVSYLSDRDFICQLDECPICGPKPDPYDYDESRDDHKGDCPWYWVHKMGREKTVLSRADRLRFRDSGIADDMEEIRSWAESRGPVWKTDVQSALEEALWLG